ncbi:hypothetical protein VTK26DRAFT_650 [Humicola hyalothermophila]
MRMRVPRRRTRRSRPRINIYSEASRTALNGADETINTSTPDSLLRLPAWEWFQGATAAAFWPQVLGVGTTPQTGLCSGRGRFATGTARYSVPRGPPRSSTRMTACHMRLRLSPRSSVGGGPVWGLSWAGPVPRQVPHTPGHRRARDAVTLSGA